MMISIIVAIGHSNVIGVDNKLPWDMPADMEHFKEKTKGKPVIVGAKTLESIGGSLPGRTNIVLTLDKGYEASGCILAYSIEEAIAAAKKTGAAEAMIIGGVSVYKQFLPLADKLYLTFIKGDFKGDAFFPEIDYTQWEEIEKEEHDADEKNPYPYTFATYQRKKQHGF